MCMELTDYDSKSYPAQLLQMPEPSDLSTMAAESPCKSLIYPQQSTLGDHNEQDDSYRERRHVRWEITARCCGNVQG